MRQEEGSSGVTYWEAVGPPPERWPALEADLRCEVVVVGGGITGALTGYLLIRAGVDAVVVDREIPGCGSTAASTGLLQYELDMPLVELIARRGESHAVHAYRRGLRAIDELAAIAEELGDRCGFARRPTLQLASTPGDGAGLRREHDCRRHFGFDVRWLAADELRATTGIRAPGALWSSGDGQVDTYALTQLLLRRARGAGLRAFGGVDVERVEESTAGVVLPIGGLRITARSVIFATGYAAHELLPCGPGRLHSTFAAATRPNPTSPSWPEDCLIWETARPYFYGRRTDDGRALVGGEDTPGPFDHEDEELMADRARRLCARLVTLFPWFEPDPDYVWAGTFAESEDGLPFIGPLPGHERVQFALGYGGNGITSGMIAARLITDLHLGRPNADAPVYRFGR
jgi:glycine/D-amino acid oxidase-like deaminating enzyme